MGLADAAFWKDVVWYWSFEDMEKYYRPKRANITIGLAARLEKQELFGVTYYRCPNPDCTHAWWRIPEKAKQCCKPAQKSYYKPRKKNVKNNH